MTVSANISPEKMTFLTANYGLSPEQVESFANGYNSAYWQMAGEIEYTWEEGGYYPDNPEEAMIECLVDADRLRNFIDDYDAWCFDFLFKMELIYDLKNMEPPPYFREYLKKEGKTWWTAAKESYRK